MSERWFIESMAVVALAASAAGQQGPPMQLSDAREWALRALAQQAVEDEPSLNGGGQVFEETDTLPETLETPAEEETSVVEGPPPPNAVFQGSVEVNEYDLVEMHVQNERLGSVLQLLSVQSERNIVVSRNVSASVTADLYGVSFFEALDALLHVNGFGYIREGNFVYVYTREEIEALEDEDRELEATVIELDFLNAVDAASFVTPLLSADGTITTPSASEDFSIPDATPTGKDDYANTAMLVVHDYPENIEAITRVIAKIDTRPTQVLIEATILQAAVTEDNAFGIDFSIIADLDFAEFGNPLAAVNRLIEGTSGGDEGDAAQPLVPADGEGRAITSTVGNTSGAAGLKVGVIDEDIAVFLRVLDEVTDVTVISNPKVLTLNRQPARVLVGTRVGYLSTTTTETSTTENVEFLDTGTQLHVRPFVTSDELIRMELKPQVSSANLRPAVSSTGRTLTIPDEDTTELVTNLYVRDGQTVVLGGLFTESTTSTRRQVPVLGDLPIIGVPFRGHDDSIRRNELIFLVTPSIISDQVLTIEGRAARKSVELARVGARQGLLPWSRERQVGQLLIEAEKYERDGDERRALLNAQRALALHPQSREAIQLRDRIRGGTAAWPSGSMLERLMNARLDAQASVEVGE
ncbi:MAG: hypothetical protein CMJ31_01820 [Phycisphaerae bacterium]|nr:hypothetical protein [Phycisphaerae bacterium]